MTNTKKTKINLKDFWNWLWNSESPWSYVVLILLIIIVIKLIIFPLLNIIFQTALPLAIVESSSMSHKITKDDSGKLILCSNSYEEKENINFDEYWEICGGWYEANTKITKEDMSNFKFPNGFHKGDLIIVSGWRDIELGDVIIFNAGREHPVIHRIIDLDPIQTKGDHNAGQLTTEKNIPNEQIIGIAIARIPYIGWPKVAICEAIRVPFICN